MEKHNILSIIGEEIRIAIAPKHSSQSNKLNEANLKKGDLVGVDDEIGVVNKVKGRVAYIKLPSSPGSFHPIEALRAKYKGKFKGKDLYIAEGKVNEAEDYKYKKYAAKAFDKINDEMFNFRHSMGIKTLTNKDMKLKKKVDSLHQAIFSLQKEMKKDGLTEGKLTEALARGLKPLLKIGSKISKKVGEDVLVKLSDKFDRIDDEQADDVASHLNMAIELMQDGSPSEARAWLKKFNTACKDALSGKSIKSAFEGVNESTVNEAKVSYNFSEEELKRVLQVLGRNASTEVKIIKAFETALGRKLTRDELFEVVKEDKLNESMIGIKTKANFKPLQLKGALERAGMKGFMLDRLSVTLSALKLDKKYYKEAMKIIDDLGLKVMMAKEGVNEAMDMNDPILVAIRARKTMLAKEKSAPKVKKLSTKQYYKLMDKEIDLLQDRKKAVKDYEELDSEMNQEAGQKGDSWSDADANRYGGKLNDLQSRIESIAKQLLSVKKQIMNYRVN